MDIKEQLDQIQKSLEAKAAADAKTAADAAIVEVKQILGEAQTKAINAEKEAAELKGEVKVLKDAADKNQEAFDTLMLNSKNAQGNNEVESKSFNQILGETIERNAQIIRNHKKGSGIINFDMLPEVKADKPENREVKAVGDMSIGANFANANTFFQDNRQNLIQSPYNRVWLADILPGGTSNGTSINFPKENGGEGGAAVWENPATDKPQMDWDLTTQTAYFKWLAGIVIADREMLDDIPFMTSYIQNKMLISLKTAENAFILNGTSGTNPVTGLLAGATAYNGTFANSVDRMVDAAWGQLVEDTEDFYSPTNFVLRPRDAVRVGLNKADGSGEYDLPGSSVAFANGRLQVGGLDTVATTQLAADNFITFDRNALMYVRRMLPELRLFEDAALAKRNKVMFRIECRSTLAIFNNKAIVKGTLTAA